MALLCKRSGGWGILLLVLLIGCWAEAQATRPAAGAWRTFRGGGWQQGVAAAEAFGERERRGWMFSAEEAFTGSAVIADGRVYAGSEDGHLYALDLKTGRERWKFKADEAIQATPAVFGGRVFFGDDEGNYYGLNAETGKELWRIKTEGQIISSAQQVGDRLVFGSYDGTIYCVDPKSGAMRWKHSTDDRVHGTPAVVDGLVLSAGCDARLHVLKLEDGRAVRQVELGAVTGASPAVAPPMAYFGTYGNQVLAVDYLDGKVVWRFEDPVRQFPFLSSAALVGDGVIVGGRDKRVRRLRQSDGTEIWKFVTRGRVDSAPVVVGARVYFGSMDGNVYGLDVGTGREVWRYETGAPVHASPAVAEGYLVIGNQDGQLFGFVGK